MSGSHNSSTNRQASNLPDNSGRSFATSSSAQPGAPSPVFHHTGSTQGIHNIHGNFNVANRPITFGSFNVANIPASGAQQPSGNLSSGQFASNNIHIPPSQISHGSSHGLSGVTNRGGMNVVGSPGYNSSENWGRSAPGYNQSAVPGGGLSMPGLDSRLNLTNNNGPGGSNRLMSGVHQQASPAVSSLLESSYHGAGTLSQNRGQSVNNPLLNSRPSSVGGPQGQVVHDNAVTTMQPQQFSVGRCAGFNNIGGSLSSHHPQQQQQLVQPVSSSGFPSSSGNNQNMCGSDFFPSSHPSYHPQTSGASVSGSRPPNSPNIGSYHQLFQKHQQQQQQSPHQHLLGSLQQPNYSNLEPHTLFYIYYSPRDAPQLFAASDELHNQGWLFHREHQLWLKPLPNMEPVKTSTHEIGSYTCFDRNTWTIFQKDNYVVHYKYLVQTPAPRPPQQ